MAVELRELQYFLAVAEEGTISAAAEALHVAQPSLSRQMKELEEKLGKSLFVRGNRRITLTEEGLLLRKRAGEMIRLMEKTEQEISGSDEELSGDIYIGMAESESVHFLTRAAGALHELHPGIRFHFISGDTPDILYQLEQGLIDFALLLYLDDQDKYNTIQLPASDHWGVLMKKDHPLAKRDSVSFRKDLVHQPLIMSRLVSGQLFPDLHSNELNIVSTYNLAHNARHMVEDGLGLAVCFESIVTLNHRPPEGLAFVPVSDLNKLFLLPSVIWKKYQVLSHISKAFVEELLQQI